MYSKRDDLRSAALVLPLLLLIASHPDGLCRSGTSGGSPRGTLVSCVSLGLSAAARAPFLSLRAGSALQEENRSADLGHAVRVALLRSQSRSYLLSKTTQGVE